MARGPGRASSSSRSPVQSPERCPSEWLVAVLSDVGMIGRGARLDDTSVRPLRGGRCPVVTVDLISGGGRRRGVVVKAYRDATGARTLCLLRQLSAAGLDTGRFRVTHGLAWSQRHLALVTERADGCAWKAIIASGDAHSAEIAGRAVGEWLTALQALPPADRWLPDRSAHRAEEDLVRQAEVLGTRWPAYRARLAAVAGVALSRTSNRARQNLVPSHGDLHPNNVYIMLGHAGGPRVTALDCDTAGGRLTAYDAGYALAQLLVMSHIRCGTFGPGAWAANGFWSAWSPSGAASSDHSAVAAQAVRALVQSLHYELMTMDNGRVELVPVWLALAESVFELGVPTWLELLGSGWTP